MREDRECYTESLNAALEMHRRLTEMDARLKQYGAASRRVHAHVATSTEMFLLGLLRRHPKGLTQKQIAMMLLVDKSTVSILTQWLVENGYIVRKAPPAILKERSRPQVITIAGTRRLLRLIAIAVPELTPDE